MKKVVNFNEYVNKKEEGLEILNAICSKVETIKRAEYLFFSHDRAQNGQVQEELTFLYSKVGYMMLGNRKLKFDDFRKNVKIGELNPETETLRLKAHFAFKANDEWYYVIVETTSGVNYDKRDLCRSTGLNIIFVNVAKFVKENKRRLEMGRTIQYIADLDNLFRDVLMKCNIQVRLLAEMKPWE